MLKRKIKALVIVISLSLVYAAVLYWCLGFFSNSKGKTSNEKVSTVYKLQNENSGVNTDKIEKGAECTFKTKYTKSGELFDDRTINIPSKYVGRSVDNFEKNYSDEGYEFNSRDGKNIIMLRKLDRYSPDKYVLGIKNGFVAIYKTDSSGKMFIEDEKSDVTNISISKLKQGDIDILTNGRNDLQFNTKSDAQANLEGFVK